MTINLKDIKKVHGFKINNGPLILSNWQAKLLAMEMAENIPEVEISDLLRMLKSGSVLIDGIPIKVVKVTPTKEKL